MLVKSERIATLGIKDACQSCGGVGKVRIVPANGSTLFASDVECSNCFGEKIITAGLIARKATAQILRRMLIDNLITIRDASNRFGGTFMEWNDARNGKAELGEINRKINLISGQESRDTEIQEELEAFGHKFD